MQPICGKHFLAYFFSALFAALLVVSPIQNVILRGIAGILLVLVLPGLALTNMLFPKDNFGGLKKLVFTSVLSLATTILLTLVLNSTSWGIQQGSWALGLLSITSAASLIGWLRSNKVQTKGVDIRLALGEIRRQKHYAILMIGAMLVAGFAVNIARTPAPLDQYDGYTILWMVPEQEHRIDSDRVEIGIDSKEFVLRRYTLQLSVNDRVIHTWSPIELSTNQKWKTTFELPNGKGINKNVKAYLYQIETPETIYRQVSLDFEK